MRCIKVIYHVAVMNVSQLVFAAGDVYLIDANLLRWMHILFAACFLYINLDSVDKALFIREL